MPPWRHCMTTKLCRFHRSVHLSSISVYVKRGELWKGVSNGVSVEPSPHNSLGNGSGARAMATGL